MTEGVWATRLVVSGWVRDVSNDRDRKLVEVSPI